MDTLKTSHNVVSVTAIQALALATAAKREDGAVTLPARLKGKAIQSFIDALIVKGLVREIRAKAGMPVCRRDAVTGRSHALVITKLGRASVPAPEGNATTSEVGPEPKAAEPSSTAPTGKRRAADDAGSLTPASTENGPETDTSVAGLEPAGGAIAPESSTAPRPGSKLDAVTALLGRDAGASVDEIMAATGWLPHTTRAALTGLRKRGFAITRERTGDGGSSRYRIEAALVLAA